MFPACGSRMFVLDTNTLQIRAWLEADGTPIGPIDVLIAATALACGGTLVTHKLKEFQRVEGLGTIDWY